MRVFLDVSFIGADGFQKGCIFLSGNYDCRLVKKVIKPAKYHLYHRKDETTLRSLLCCCFIAGRKCSLTFTIENQRERQKKAKKGKFLKGLVIDFTLCFKKKLFSRKV